MARAKKERAKYVAVIESLDQEGRGVARRDGKVVFIEGALPGEKIEYEVYRSKPSFELGLTTRKSIRSLRFAFCRSVLISASRTAAAAAVPCSTSKRMLRLPEKQKVLMDALWHIRQDSPRAGAGTDLWLCMEIPPPRSFVRA